VKRIALIVLALFCVLPTSGLAQTDAVQTVPAHRSGSIGFHSIEAPIGTRWWLGGQKIGIDLGLGLSSTPAPSYDEESLTGWAIDVGIPIVVKNWDMVHVLFRPGFLYESQEEQMSSPPDPFDSDSETSFTVTAELEAEVFIVHNFSVSASSGFGFVSESPAGGGDSETSFGTLGNNFSHIGFHVYFLGGGE
jgi:hypothetical protein